MSDRAFYNVAERGSFGLLEILFWLCPVAAFFLFPTSLSFATHVLIMALFAMSLGLVLSFAGIVTLGHAAFFGLGAYTTALLSLAGLQEPISATFLGGVAAGVLALVIGPLLLRLTGLPLMMVTLALGAVLFEAANKLGWITGGENGLGDLKYQPVLGLFRWSIYGQTAYLYALAWVFVLFLLTRALVASPFGLALQGIRENPLRMRLIGAPVTGHLVRVYVISAFIAGIAGALSAQATGFVGLDVLSVDLSISALVMLVLGGVGNIYGGLVGGALYIVLRNLASDWNPYHWMFVIGAFLVLVVLLGQNGVIGIFERIVGWIADKRRDVSR